MSDTRNRILDATVQLLSRDGVDSVTIASVAREAGVSKGGLFYHFASKEALIAGLAARYVATFDALIDLADDQPGAATRAYLASAITEQSSSQPVQAMLATAIISPDAMATLQDRYRRWQDRLDADGLPAHVAAMVRVAVDGLWMADAFDLAPIPPETRERVIAELQRLVDDALDGN